MSRTSLTRIIVLTDTVENGMPANLRMTDDEFVIPDDLCHDPEVDKRVDEAIKEGREILKNQTHVGTKKEKRA